MQYHWKNRNYKEYVDPLHICFEIVAINLKNEFHNVVACSLFFFFLVGDLISFGHITCYYYGYQMTHLLIDV